MTPLDHQTACGDPHSSSATHSDTFFEGPDFKVFHEETIINLSDVEPFRCIDMVLGAPIETATKARARHNENEARLFAFVDNLKHIAASQYREPPSIVRINVTL